MKKILSFALIGAVVAGVIYLLKDDDTINEWIGEANEAGSEGLTMASDGYSDVRDVIQCPF